MNEVLIKITRPVFKLSDDDPTEPNEIIMDYRDSYPLTIQGNLYKFKEIVKDAKRNN